MMSSRLQPFLAPKGPKQISPGQRPGDRIDHPNPSPERATHAWSEALSCAALSGLFWGEPRFPGRCPGLVCSGPFGAGKNIPDASVSTAAFLSAWIDSVRVESEVVG